MYSSSSEVDVESDACSVDGEKDTVVTNEQVARRMESLQQENRVLRTEVETLKLKIKGLNELVQQLRRNSVNIQAKAEQEEEYISNTLLKKITELKKEKESLALNYEQEEECLTNELNRKFTQLRQEKVALERTLAREQEDQVGKLKLRIEKLETDMKNKQECLDRLRREKIELENALEQEQESLVNRLWKKMEKLETEKRTLQEKLSSLGALLSASSSNQSLASATHASISISEALLGCSTAGSTAFGTGAPCNRPISSGPGSLRSSQRHHSFPHHPANATSQFPHSVSPSQSSIPGSLTSARPFVQLNVLGDTVSTAPDARLQLNQSASATGEPQLVKIGSNGVFSGTNLVLPQSPMDVDSLDHPISDSVSPCRIDNNVGGHAPGRHTTHSLKLITQPSVDGVPVSKIAESEDLDTTFPQSAPPRTFTPNWNSHTTSVYVNQLREEVCHLRRLLMKYETENANKMPAYESEERSTIEENRRLRKLLQIEKERREALSRQLSESESSLEMEDERQFNEACRNPRLRTTSDSSFHPPGYMAWSSSTNPVLYRPGHAYAAAVAAGLSGHSTVNRCCRECGQRLPPVSEDWCVPVSAHSSSSIGRVPAPAPPTTLHTGVTHTAAGRTAYQGAAYYNSPGKPYAPHHVSLPNSPATPTTSSSVNIGVVAQAFAIPSTRVPSMMTGSSDRISITSDPPTRDSMFFDKGLSSCSSNEQLFVRVDGDNETNEPDEDEDARCVTPPVGQRGSSTKAH